jgi:hypothetical protein
VCATAPDRNSTLAVGGPASAFAGVDELVDAGRDQPHRRILTAVAAHEWPGLRGLLRYGQSSATTQNQQPPTICSLSYSPRITFPTILNTK